MPTEPQPSFVVLEGMDGVGTTTTADLLAQALKGRDLRVHVTCEPSEGPFGRLLRQHIQHELTLEATAAGLIFTADRADHLASEIAPALARGEWIVCDRYLLSTLAYQGAGGVDREAILAASSAFLVPDVTFFLDAPDGVREGRMAGRESVERYEDPELAEALRTSYQVSIDLLRSRGHRIEIVDASAPIADVLQVVLARLDAAS